MKWNIIFSNSSLKFLKKEKIPEKKIITIIKNVVLKFQGKDLNIDIKKLKGKWLGFHRIRIGKIRIIVEFNFDDFIAFIERIDWRGKIY